MTVVIGRVRYMCDSCDRYGLDTGVTDVIVRVGYMCDSCDRNGCMCDSCDRDSSIHS